MKKVLLFLVAAMLVGKMSVGEWRKIIDKDEFVRFIGVTLCNELNCEEADIEAKKVGKNILFFWECLDPESGSESKKSEKVDL